MNIFYVSKHYDKMFVDILKEQHFQKFSILGEKPACDAFGDHCYIIVQLYKLTYYKARNTCEEWNMKLLTIETDKEMHELSAYLDVHFVESKSIIVMFKLICVMQTDKLDIDYFDEVVISSEIFGFM